VSCFSTGITLHFSSSSSSSSDGKIVSSSIVSSSINSSSLYLTMISSNFFYGLLELFSGNSSTSIKTFPSVMLALLPCQLFLFFQGYLISIFYIFHFHHDNLILDFIRSINVSGNFPLIILPISCFYVYLVKLLSVFFHYKPLYLRFYRFLNIFI
jgi:hypothetical protein